MNVQRIENLDQRIAEWEKDRDKWLKSEVPTVLIIGAIVCSGILYFLSQYQSGIKESWLLLGVISGCLLTIPLLKSTHPKKPTQRDVEADVELRKMFNMDSTVSKYRKTK